MISLCYGQAQQKMHCAFQRDNNDALRISKGGSVSFSRKIQDENNYKALLEVNACYFVWRGVLEVSRS